MSDQEEIFQTEFSEGLQNLALGKTFDIAEESEEGEQEYTLMGESLEVA